MYHNNSGSNLPQVLWSPLLKNCQPTPQDGINLGREDVVEQERPATEQQRRNRQPLVSFINFCFNNKLLFLYNRASHITYSTDTYVLTKIILLVHLLTNLENNSYFKLIEILINLLYIVYDTKYSYFSIVKSVK